MATFDDFQKLDIRAGEIVEISEFPEARNPSYKLKINFGDEIGIKNSSVQIVNNYKKEDLKGKKVMGIVNFPPRQIGPFMSEVLTLGVPAEDGECILVVPDKNVPVGGKLY
jgi:tRNA-binding protein